MRFHCNTTPDETIQFLRDSAIASRAAPQVIDAIDALRDLLDTPAELEKAGEELAQAETDRDDLRDELSTLVDHMQTAVDIIESIHNKPEDAATFFEAGDLKDLQRYLSFAERALERHKA